jgi:glycosyltransferase involved in cell wall biosynthesis
VIPSNGTEIVLSALEANRSRAGETEVIMFDVTAKSDPFTSSVRERVRRAGLDSSVRILGGVPHEEMPDLLASADVGMIAYGRGLGEDSLPNRLFEYMAAGLAILAPSYASQICAILDTEGIGITADFDDPADVARALTWLADHPQEREEMGRRARESFVARHSWEQEFKKLSDAMRE